MTFFRHMRGPALTGLLCLIVLAGCGDPKVGLAPGEPPVVNTEGKLSAQDLAARLGMTLDQAGPKGATLTDAHNVVTIYPEPAPQVYINGALVAEEGIVADATTVYVPAWLERGIAGGLRHPVMPPPVAPVPSIPIPAVPRPRPRTPLQRVPGCVVVDAGHGGKDPGARASSGLQEKHVVLDVAQKVAAQLKAAGTDTRLTRSSDTFLELEQRAAFANACSADLFVSIHADSASRRSAQGFSTYVARSASRNSDRAADAIRRNLSGAGVPTHGKGRHEADYRVLVQTTGPAVLVELGFLSNAGEAARLASPGYRTRLAGAIAQGVIDYLSGK